MAGITLAQAEAKLTLWMAAEDAVANRGQAYSIEGRSLSRANLAEIRDAIDYWDRKVNELTAVAGRGRRVSRAVQEA
ncbi:MAG: DUF6148 family protein [Nocardioides sp.]